MPIVFILLFLIAGTLSAVTAFFLWRSYRESKNPAVFFLMLMFGFLGGYGLMISVPPLLAAQQPDIVGFWRIVALMLVFAVILASLPVQYALSTGLFRKISKIIFVVVVILALFTLVELIQTYQAPVIGPYMIEWNTSVLAKWILALSSLLYGFLWAFIFFRDAFKVEYKTQHYKLLVLGGDGIMLGVAGFVGFLETEAWHAYTAVALFILAMLITLIMLAGTSRVVHKETA